MVLEKTLESPLDSKEIKPVEKEMATHSSVLAWRIPWTVEPGRLYSPRGCEESDTSERLHFHALEKEMGSQSQTRLK